MGLAFFGLAFDTVSQARAAIFTQIHEIVFHGKGGYDWNTVYNMPIWLRRFTFSKIHSFYTEEKETLEKKSSGGKQTVINSDGTIKTPNLFPKSSSTKSPVKYG